MQTRFSIILPVFNAASYLEKAIDSLLEQSIDDWELIAVNDASSDKSLNILKKYAALDNRIKLVDLIENRGLGHVRNLGIKKAVGDYLIFLDSDDFFEPAALKVLNNNISINPETEVFIWGFNKVDGKGDFKKSFIPMKISKEKGETPFILHLAGRKGFVSYVWVYSLKRSFLSKYELSFPEKIYFEDIPFTVQMLYHASELQVISEPLYNYRKHGFSITGKAGVKKIEDKYIAFNQVKTFLEEQRVFKQFQRMYLARFLALCVHTSFNDYFSLSKNESTDELDSFMNEIRNSKLLRKDNLLLLRNIGLSLPKEEKRSRLGFLQAYFGLSAIKKRYFFQKQLIYWTIKLKRKRQGLS
ncbi:glycosyltransferase family A protein [Arenibacter sp. GZD96]|uniref:glycosyltransferase family 2 protein n=1 Tax=Aurantibrevibacter litoralis TaxID=3106030 RepID=UPI002AFE3194|nr:glycosyltransferase family A protein [Arenibacter sp. GZD-96]MEA1787162.1 glycosyltransferase family A protein [Arenibacter sp. GZD-96]